MSVFVDTNILVYAHDADAGDRHQRSAELLRELWSRPEHPWISVQVLQELYVNLRRKMVDPEDAQRVVENYFAWSIVQNDTALLQAAMGSSSRWRVSLWDALIIEAARRAGATQLWTEDLNEGQHFEGVQVINPLHT